MVVGVGGLGGWPRVALLLHRLARAQMFKLTRKRAAISQSSEAVDQLSSPCCWGHRLELDLDGDGLGARDVRPQPATLVSQDLLLQLEPGRATEQLRLFKHACPLPSDVVRLQRGHSNR